MDDQVTITVSLQETSSVKALVNFLMEFTGIDNDDIETTEEDVALLNVIKDTPAGPPGPEVPPPPGPEVPPPPPGPEVPPPPPGPAGSPVTDVSGLPWDERIHAKTKTKKADGCWKLRRGVDKGIVASVTAELRANPAAPPPAADLTVLTPPNVDEAQGAKNVIFTNLMQKVTGMVTPPAEGGPAKTTLEVLNQIPPKHGVANFPALLQAPLATLNIVASEVDALCLTLG